jgi:hypothetical protein
VDGTVMKVTTLSPLAAASGVGATRRSGMFGKNTARPGLDASDSHSRAPAADIVERRAKERARAVVRGRGGDREREAAETKETNGVVEANRNC